MNNPIIAPDDGGVGVAGVVGIGGGGGGGGGGGAVAIHPPGYNPFEVAFGGIVDNGGAEAKPIKDDAEGSSATN